MKNIKALFLTVLIFSIGNVVAKEHMVKMVNGKAPELGLPFRVTTSLDTKSLKKQRDQEYPKECSQDLIST